MLLVIGANDIRDELVKIDWNEFDYCFLSVAPKTAEGI